MSGPPGPPGRRLAHSSTALLVGLAACTGLLVGLSVRVFRVRSTSMTPTLAPGDLVLGIRLLAPPNRDAVVALRGPERWRLKRLVGVPGDAVALRGARLLRNRTLVREPHASYARGGVLDLPAVVLGRGQLVALGDNRDGSLDSRQLGVFPLASARYQVLARLWPPARAGWLE